MNWNNDAAHQAVQREARALQRHYDRGFMDGRKGLMRGHGSALYHEGYDDGLDVYDCEHAEEEGWDDTHCQAGS